MRRVENAPNLTQQVVDSLRHSILTGELPPGSLCSVYQLADRLGVSRTPVREAVVRLAEAGMVAFERNRGIRILTTSAHDLQEVFQLRLLLEVPAARRAAAHAGPAGSDGLRVLESELTLMRAAAARHDQVSFVGHDRALHDQVLRTAGNTNLLRIVRQLRDVTMTLGATTVDRSRTLADIAEEHAPIVAAMRAGDGRAAAEAMAGHIAHTGELLLAQLVADGRGAGEVDPAWAGAFR